MLLLSPYIKFVVWAVFVVSGIGLVLIYALPAASSTRIKQNGLPTSPTENSQITGVVKDFGSNRNGDVDELLISNADGGTWVNFPPHTARQVMKLAPKGKPITVWVNEGPPHPPGPAGKPFRYQLAQLQVGDAVLPLNNMPPPPPVAGKPLELNGTIDSLITGKHGEIAGLVVSGYRITLPPHLAQSIAPLLQPGKQVGVKGYERNADDGFVNTDKHKLVKPYRMTIDSTDYLL